MLNQHYQQRYLPGRCMGKCPVAGTGYSDSPACIALFADELFQGGIILTKTSMLGFALTAMALSMYIQDLKPDYFLIILWSVIGVVGTILTLNYLKNLSVSGTGQRL